MIPIEIDCASVKNKLDLDEPFFFLDCREQDEHAQVNIPQATLLPMSEIQDRVAELDAHKAEDVIVMCHHGGRSLQVAMWLRQQGFVKAQSMSGGIDVWAQTIEPGMTRY